MFGELLQPNCVTFTVLLFLIHFNGISSLQTRAVFERALEPSYTKVEDLASVWCEYAEFELRQRFVLLIVRPLTVTVSKAWISEILFLQLLQ